MNTRAVQSGFTLVELTVTLVILAILSAVAVPKMLGNQTFDLRGFSDQTQGLLRYAQKHAIAQQRAVYVDLSNTTRIGLCYDSGCTSKVPAPTGGNAGTTLTISKCGNSTWFCIPVPSGISYSASPLTVFYFDALGKPYASSGTAFSGNLTLTFSGDSTTRTVYVERETGYVHT